MNIEEEKTDFQKEETASAPVTSLDKEAQSTASGCDAKANTDVASKKTAINLSVIGLIASLLCGVGIFFSLAGIIMGCVNRKQDALVSRYAIVMGISGSALSIIFAFLEIYAVTVMLSGL